MFFLESFRFCFVFWIALSCNLQVAVGTTITNLCFVITVLVCCYQVLWFVGRATLRLFFALMFQLLVSVAITYFRV